MDSTTFNAVTTEVRMLFHELVWAGEQLHVAEQAAIGQRAILEFLFKKGPSTVSAIAAARDVNRQYMHGQVDVLFDLGLVAVVPAGPMQGRTRPVALTDQGRACVARMQTREHAAVERLDVELGAKEAAYLVGQLREIRFALRRLSADQHPASHPR